MNLVQVVDLFRSGLLQNLDYNQLECQALVLTPTRELAKQLEQAMRTLGDDVHVTPLILQYTTDKIITPSARSPHRGAPQA